MEITMAILAPVFESLIDGRMSREEASDWAIRLEKEWDHDIHTVSPSCDASLVYETLDLLKAADYKNSPTEYFYEPQDFVDYYNKHLKHIS